MPSNVSMYRSKCHDAPVHRFKSNGIKSSTDLVCEVCHNECEVYKPNAAPHQPPQEPTLVEIEEAEKAADHYLSQPIDVMAMLPDPPTPGQSLDSLGLEELREKVSQLVYGAMDDAQSNDYSRSWHPQQDHRIDTIMQAFEAALTKEREKARIQGFHEGRAAANNPELEHGYKG